MSKEIVAKTALEENAEQENLDTQQVSDDTKQNELNSISETNKESTDLNSSVQSVPKTTGSNNPAISSSMLDQDVIEKFDVDLIKSKMQQAIPDSAGVKQFITNLDGTKVTFSEVNELITYTHNKKNDCALIVECSGTLDLQLSMLMCACKFGSRELPFNTTLSFFENPKHRNKKRNELSANEQIALTVISKFSGKSSSIIKKLMLEGKTIVAGDAKKLGIIDNVTGLEDRDASARSAAATGRKKKKELTPA
ncbi:MAG: hypothetical protein J0M18_08360 [Ignavibacteria bacterium]|nr:hypothetical protein [Ignavibacteria bacterium]